jgi:hypothetical protein
METVMTVSEELELRPDEWVEVRSAAEILATLDDKATLEGLPFMPEMLAYCGQRFAVHQRADKTCDTVTFSGMRRMERTVHLTGLRCDGAAHGGCQAGCLLFWKEAWLRRSPPKPGQFVVADGLSTQPVLADSPQPAKASTASDAGATVRNVAWLAGTAVQDRPGETEIRYRCQATELKKASQPLPWWKPGQYFRDVFVNKVPWTAVLRGLATSLCNKLLRRLTGRGFPNVAGTLERTPTEVLDLQPGEWVIVKSKEEILATVDETGRNRGLTFDAEMLPYCGRRMRVLRRVERIIEEPTGRLISPRTASIILDGAVCRSVYRRACPRCIFSYWREIWLRRDPEQPVPDDNSDLAESNSRAQVESANPC